MDRLRRIAAEFKSRQPRSFIEFTPEGEMLPFGYGLAWRCPMTGGCYTAPMPANVLIAWVRRTFIWIRFEAPGGAVWFDDKLYEAYLLGMRERFGGDENRRPLRARVHIGTESRETAERSA